MMFLKRFFVEFEFFLQVQVFVSIKSDCVKFYPLVIATFKHAISYDIIIYE